MKAIAHDYEHGNAKVEPRSFMRSLSRVRKDLYEKIDHPSAGRRGGSN